MKNNSASGLVAFHLDMKLHQYRKPYLKTLFHRLAEIGYNAVVFEIEDKVKLKTIQGASDYEAFSKEDFSAILSDCRRAGLQPIPLIQTLGHLEFLLSHPPFQTLRDEHRKLIENIYTPASIERELNIVFMAHINHLLKLAGGGNR